MSVRKLQNECEYFIGEKKIVKSEYICAICEHLKLREDFWREHFKILVIKKRVKRLFSRSKKAREKKNLWLHLYSTYIALIFRIANVLYSSYTALILPYTELIFYLSCTYTKIVKKIFLLYCSFTSLFCAYILLIQYFY